MRAALLFVLAFAQLPYARQALDLGHTHDEAMFDAFNHGYELATGDVLDRAEIITEFRRAVMIVRERDSQGDYLTPQDLAKAMQPFDGQVTVIVQARLHPLHTYANAPSYDLYVETGPSTRPLAAKPLKRAPVYPPGVGPGNAMVAVRLEAAFARADVEAAAAPMLVVTDDQANVIWKGRLDLSRYR
jgi:hypothetical protein